MPLDRKLQKQVEPCSFLIMKQKLITIKLEKKVGID